MKKSSKIIIILLLITITLSTIIFIFGKDENILENNEKEKNTYLTYMLETGVSSNKYEAKNDIKFPLDGYHINIEKSGCENGGTLSWNSEKQKIESSLLTSDRCYVFLDNVQVKSEFPFTGNYEEYIVPTTGTYKIELWGAQGGGAHYDYGTGNETDGYAQVGDFIEGGKGAYTKGIINLKKDEVIYIYVGGMGNDYSSTSFFHDRPVGGYNGGGTGGWHYQIAGSGGGATDIRLVKGNWNNFDSLKSRIMVAAGGGGTSNYRGAVPGGYGGALNGGSGNLNKNSVAHQLATGGTQKSGGNAAIGQDNNRITMNGSFGIGGESQAAHGSGGGSGYYGGGGSTYVQAGVSSGAGGSSFISGYPGCDAIDEKSTENEIIHTGEPNHYSGKVFTDSEMIAGNSTMPKPEGGTEVGHTGNGYARITLVK